ncbi:MAG: hypothetical protein JJT81_04615 [Rubellimicrobium sp.]|nr:hypothetical protein [Rubellimicrobium sp.]
MFPRRVLASCLALLALGTASAPAPGQAETLSLFASGEDLATEGFTAPELSKDGWALTFTRIIATFDEVTAWQTDPPFMGDGPEILGTALAFGGPFTVDLVDADDEDRVLLASLPAAPGHYNALSWALVPAAGGEFAGFSLVLEGLAERGGEEVAFTLATPDAVFHACGEYLGDARKGFVTADAGGDLEITLHLDHLFGRADRSAEDGMNLDAPGFDPFAGQGPIAMFTLAGLHLGHVGEGHCHVSPR